MPSILTEYEGVSFIAARPFIWGDNTYQMGDDVPDAKTFGNLESLVRSRRLIPVIDNKDDAPFQFHREVMSRELALTKLGLDPSAAAGHEDPAKQKEPVIEVPRVKPVTERKKS